MTPAPEAQPESVSHRLRQRIFHPWSGAGNTALAAPAAPQPKTKSAIGLQARIAEFLLILRLRARHKSEPSADVLQRAERIVFITCQNWFAPPEQRKPRRHTQL